MNNINISASVLSAIYTEYPETFYQTNTINVWCGCDGIVVVRVSSRGKSLERAYKNGQKLLNSSKPFSEPWATVQVKTFKIYRDWEKTGEISLFDTCFSKEQADAMLEKLKNNPRHSRSDFFIIEE